MDLAPTRQVGAHSCRCREKRSRSNLFFFGRRPCGCVDRRSASEQESSSDEKPTRMPHDVPMAAHETLLLYLYYQPPHHPPSLTSSPDARQRQRRAASSRRSSLSFVPSKLSEWPFPSFFLLVSFLSFFRYAGRRHPHHLRGSLHRHHRFFIVRIESIFYHPRLTCHVPPQHLRHPFDAMLHLLPPVPSGSTILQDAGTYSITK